MGTDPDEDYATVSWTVPVAAGMLAIRRNLNIHIFQVLKPDLLISLRGNVLTHIEQYPTVFHSVCLQNLLTLNKDVTLKMTVFWVVALYSF